MLTTLCIAAMILPQSQRPGAAITIAARPPMGQNDYYVGNREPLLPSAFRKLPVGSIQPKGWIRKQLELQAEGFVGHLPEISKWLKKDNNAWLSPTGEGENGWEEVPYWLKGFGDTGYVLGDPRIIGEAKVWVEGILSSQQPNGYFGPKSNLTANKGKPDIWPNMVALNCLQTYHEFSGDPRVLQAMSRYFRWQLELPEEDMLLSYWERHRGGDNLASVFWLYNRTGEEWLLELADKLHRRTADWVGGVPDRHGVNFAQAFREPATYYVLSRDPKHFEATEQDYKAFYELFGQVPGGMYGADENARTGYDDPRQAAETCAMVEMMLSCQMLLGFQGDPKWAERCEDVAFNSLPASMTPDLKGLRYLTSPNMAKSDKGSKSPHLQNSGPMLLFDPNDHRCCQHNVSHGWPYYAEHLWMATSMNGLAPVFYAPSVVKARVGDGTEVTITEETNYPFDEVVRFKVQTPKPVRFPLTLRIPSWSKGASLRLNGIPLALPGKGEYAVFDNEWIDGDVIELRLPMQIELKRWVQNENSASVQHGPLTYSLDIGERYEVAGGTSTWPALEVYPQKPWNYGLLARVGSMKFERAPFPQGQNPFTPETAPVRITAKGRRIPEWQLDRLGLVGLLQPSPVFSSQPEEELILIPMGSTRVRISAFPTISAAPSAHRWAPPRQPRPGLPAKASHVHEHDTLEALTDGLMPRSSNDQEIPRFTWWPRKGGTEWVEVELAEAREISQSDVYWFDDRTTSGGCRVPTSWRLLYGSEGQWVPVKNSTGFTSDVDRVNSVRFDPVTAQRFRIEVDLQDGYSGGILEWMFR